MIFIRASLTALLEGMVSASEVISEVMVRFIPLDFDAPAFDVVVDG